MFYADFLYISKCSNNFIQIFFLETNNFAGNSQHWAKAGALLPCVTISRLGVQDTHNSIERMSRSSQKNVVLREAGRPK
jgi:hypothetical protein